MKIVDLPFGKLYIEILKRYIILKGYDMTEHDNLKSFITYETYSDKIIESYSKFQLTIHFNTVERNVFMTAVLDSDPKEWYIDLRWISSYTPVISCFSDLMKLLYCFITTGNNFKSRRLV